MRYDDSVDEKEVGMSEKVYLSRASVGEEEKQALASVIDGMYLGMGQQVMLFENELAEYLSSPVACVCNGTAALHLAVQACGIGEGDEVIIPSITYVASFQAVSASGATPIACDVDPVTNCTSVEDAARRITPRTKAIMHVHYASGMGDREGIFKLAKQHNLRVIEDAAHSFGGMHNGKRVGSEGDVFCFSFDGIKNITCGEGGAVVSHDESVINNVRDLRLLGIQNDSAQRYAGKRTWDFDVTEQGWRYHLSNLHASVGRAQLKKIADFAVKRQALAKAYNEQLRGLPLRMLPLDYDQVVPHIFAIVVEPEKRAGLMAFLADHQIETGLHYKPNHQLTKYQSTNCPHADAWGLGSLTLPLHVSLSTDDVMRITKLIREYFSR